MQKSSSVMNDLYKIGERMSDSSDGRDSQPSALLERRYTDFLRSRGDLVERLTEMETRLAESEKRLESVKNNLQTVRTLLKDLPEVRQDKAAFTDRSELADAMLRLERLRLETIRVSSSMENPDRAVSSSSADKKTPILLDSLTFRQIFRVAYIGSLPYVFGLIIMALIISFAVIGSLKGWF